KNGSVKVTRTDLHRCYSPISFTVIRMSEETRKDGKKIDYPARPLLGFTGEDVQMIEEIILAHLDR
ncbi:phage virion morphogenesis protein, partial [Escherichia coli]